jgi:hypothetical protein
VKWMQFSPWKGLVESPGWYQCDREVTTGLAEGCVVLRRTDVPTTPLKRRSTIILHGSISQKTTLNINKLALIKKALTTVSLHIKITSLCFCYIVIFIIT